MKDPVSREKEREGESRTLDILFWPLQVYSHTLPYIHMLINHTDIYPLHTNMPKAYTLKKTLNKHKIEILGTKKTLGSSLIDSVSFCL